MTLADDLQQQPDPTLVGHLGAVYLGFKNQPFRIYEQVSLASAKSLALIVPLFATNLACLGRLLGIADTCPGLRVSP